VNAADRKGRQPDLRRHLTEEVEPRKVVERLGARWERRACAEIIGAVKHGLPGLGQRVGRDANESRWTNDCPSVLHTQLFLAHMNAVRSGQHGQIRPVVHHKQGLRPFRQLAQQSGTLQKLAIVELLVPKLEDVNSGADEGTDQRHKRLNGTLTVKEHVKPGSAEALQTGPRDLHGPMERIRAISESFQASGQLGIEDFAKLLQTAQALLDPNEIGREHFARILPMAFPLGRQPGPHIGLRFPCGQPLVEWDSGHGAGQFMPQFLELIGQVAVVEDKTCIVLHHAQPLPRPVPGGIQHTQDSDELGRGSRRSRVPLRERWPWRGAVQPLGIQPSFRMRGTVRRIRRECCLGWPIGRGTDLLLKGNRLGRFLGQQQGDRRVAIPSVNVTFQGLGIEPLSQKPKPGGMLNQQ